MNIKYKFAIQAILGVILVIIAFLGLKADFAPFISWWTALFLLGMLFLPLTCKIFNGFFDNGYLFSKTIGFAVTGYLMWLFSSLRWMKFTSASCVIVVVVCSLANIFILIKNKNKENTALFSNDKLVSMITEELLFFAIFLIWIYIRGFKPEAYGTEKFMDYGFMTSMMRSDYMPPKDLWFAGSTINYYYVGQFLATFMTKVSFVSVNVGYNLMLMTLAAFAFVLPYSLVANITKQYFSNDLSMHKKAPVFAGILSGAGVSLASNMHFPIFYWIVPRICKMFGYDGDYSKYWFPDSTRYIGYNPDTHDKTIHEYPSYSFILGDLHAHVINIMFVITVLAILFAWLIHRKKQNDNGYFSDKQKNINVLNEILNPFILLLAFFIGLFHTTNFWDFPIYYVVAGAIILFSNGILYNFTSNTIWVTAIQGIFIITAAKIFVLPFTLNFDQISTEIYLTVAQTPFYQMIVLWGLPISLVIGLLLDLILKFRLKSLENDSISINASKKKKWKPFLKIQSFMKDLNYSDLFIVTIGLCAIGLVIIPEIIYIKDIYSGDYKRANTMFKLTYQAFIMFGICSGYIFIKYLKIARSLRKIIIMIPFLLFLSSLWYPKVAVSQWYGNIFQLDKNKGLDAAAFMKTTMPDDYLGTKWLNDHVKDMPVVLESNGDSYTDYERVSVITGLPTVVGWHTHEWLWRGSVEVVDKRAADVKTIYTSTDMEEVLSLLDKYEIEYIYVGKLERDKYTMVNNNLLKKLGKVVFVSPVAPEKDYETYIVHVEPKG